MPKRVVVRQSCLELARKRINENYSLPAFLPINHSRVSAGIGGNASISANGTSANVALPANTQPYPAVIIAPAAGVTTEIFYALGNASVEAIAGLKAPRYRQMEFASTSGLTTM